MWKNPVRARITFNKCRIDDSECRELAQSKDSILPEETFQCLWQCDKSLRSILHCDKYSQIRESRRKPLYHTIHPWNRIDLREAKRSSRVKACHSLAELLKTCYWTRDALEKTQCLELPWSILCFRCKIILCDIFRISKHSVYFTPMPRCNRYGNTAPFPLGFETVTSLDVRLL